jgi:hypothetical protein
MTEQELSPGRIVHYVVNRGRSEGSCRPAIVVNTFAKPGQKSTYGQGDMANMVVFADGSNDGKFSSRSTFKAGVETVEEGLLTVWQTSVHAQHAARVPGMWHWPRECEDMVDPEKGHNHPPGFLDAANCPQCSIDEAAKRGDG